jgi:thiol:disulfide interchange protein DsbD
MSKLTAVMASLCLAASSAGASPAVAVVAPKLHWTLALSQQRGAAPLDKVAAELRRARQAHQPVVIDFFADWCGACRVLERDLLSDPEVIRELARFVTIRIDATDDDAVTAELSQRFGVTVLPTVVFLGAGGDVLAEPQLRGLVDRAALLLLLRAVPSPAVVTPGERPVRG